MKKPNILSYFVGKWILWSFLCLFDDVAPILFCFCFSFLFFLSFCCFAAFRFRFKKKTKQMKLCILFCRKTLFVIIITVIIIVVNNAVWLCCLFCLFVGNGNCKNTIYIHTNILYSTFHFRSLIAIAFAIVIGNRHRHRNRHWHWH